MFPPSSPSTPSTDTTGLSERDASLDAPSRANAARRDNKRIELTKPNRYGALPGPVTIDRLRSSCAGRCPAKPPPFTAGLSAKPVRCQLDFPSLSILEVDSSSSILGVDSSSSILGVNSSSSILGLDSSSFILGVDSSSFILGMVSSSFMLGVDSPLSMRGVDSPSFILGCGRSAPLRTRRTVGTWRTLNRGRANLR